MNPDKEKALELAMKNIESSFGKMCIRDSVRMALVQDEDEMKKAIESIKNSDILK